ncbi:MULTISPECIES: carbohydrate ABC transporter permease [unclassified Mesorhizobium]|uniref:carbohydrate ABC transporter permease n=1 Tax=unclassified Mesorhizobium TaxID=325217 RepID=UPI001CCA8C7A|nr:MULTISPECIES: sugar ABC transporter permease [unclassified Mesorhizobium]MBZ9701891.1 sugar ABC transporter permease [Mesorhizobium sp. CO1-1-3]MBZ9895488.1 sugar ABC transporter permease [Mesorhizobium sp. BR1-1-6]MBZ9917506.1 sugar ABC transporter permease [Mesorhizobium sp. BR1-1-7]MBZ9945324.1 sugar ABC transporter permease [Mesorhizobium sp. BR1-1-11]MBZ9953884.1 sugar ABC transporter permease [Mesorhizobium sp. BR1-1-15]
MSATAPERAEATTSRAGATTDRAGATTDRTGVTKQASEGGRPVKLAPSYWPFVVPALVVVGAVIVFPWAFTLWMSVNRWTLGQSRSFAGMENYLRLVGDGRFWESLAHTLSYTFLSVAAPMLLGTVAALIFDARFPLRGVLRGIFVMPMMATPVAVALVWTMMFHPQLGVLNYLLSLVGIPAQEWIFNARTVIPSLVAVETWQWTPLVMLIVLGGLASVPREPFESAEIDGANAWQQFRYLTLPMIAPFLMIAVIIRTIDALKSFDIIYAMTQGGPGTASETINIYLYNIAFSYYDVGYGSAMAVVFFVLIVALSFVLLMLRQRSRWTDAEGK